MATEQTPEGALWAFLFLAEKLLESDRVISWREIRGMAEELFRIAAEGEAKEEE